MITVRPETIVEIATDSGETYTVSPGAVQVDEIVLAWTDRASGIEQSSPLSARYGFSFPYEKPAGEWYAVVIPVENVSALRCQSSILPNE